MASKFFQSFMKPKQLMKEEQCLQRNHSLDRDGILVKEQIVLLDNFKTKLYLCYKDRKADKIKFQHWFVTDKSWVIEVGLDECNVDEQRHNHLKIHTMMDKKDYCVYKQFDLDSQVRKRMLEVCGMVNHSFLLRNSEHVARYIHCGRWISLQASVNGTVTKQFEQILTKNIVKIMNSFPDELRNETEEKYEKVYHEEYQCDLIFDTIKSSLSSADNDSYNIVMIGPTGSGKSSMINLLFNKNISTVSAGARSETQEVIFLQGSYDFERTIDGNKVQVKYSKINVIDTIGLCDTVMSKEEVFNIIKDKIETNCFHIDRVVFVCSGRVEGDHQTEIKQFMKWLKYKEYKTNFAFVYNKCDGMGEAEKLVNLTSVCDMLGIDAATKIDYFEAKSTPLVITTGFPPYAPFHEISSDILQLQETILLPNKEHSGHFIKYDESEEMIKRIPLSHCECNIL